MRVVHESSERDIQAWLTDVLKRIADHEITRLDELFPWRYAEPRQSALTGRARSTPRWVHPTVASIANRKTQVRRRLKGKTNVRFYE